MMKRGNTNEPPGMRTFFKARGPVYALIDEYAEWKFGIHPYQAGAQRSLLIRMCESRGIKKVEDIDEQQMAYFVGGELTDFYAEQAIKALRSFLWYSRKAGYNCIGHNAVATVRLQLKRERAKVEASVQKAQERKPHWKTSGFTRWKRI